MTREIDDMDVSPAPQENPFDISAVVSSRKWNAVKAVVYGVPGIGKTSFAATFPSPILIRLEDGASALDIPTFPKVIANLKELAQALNALEFQQHKYKTVILDSLDWLEGLVWQGVCLKHGKKHIEDWGYGKGYIYVDEVWHGIIKKLDNLQKRGMNVVAISHAAIITISAPDTEDYMTYSLKLHKRASAIWTEWADELLFINYEKRIVRQGEGLNARMKAKGDGDRVIYTQSRPAYTAKSRYPLPDEIFIGQDKSWQAFHKSLSEASDGQYLAN